MFKPFWVKIREQREEIEKLNSIIKNNEADLWVLNAQYKEQKTLLSEFSGVTIIKQGIDLWNGYKYAFTVDGTDYYEPAGIDNLPYMRGLQAAHVYAELGMKCDVEYIKQHTAAFNAIVEKRVGPKEVSQLMQLNAMLEERIKWIYTPDLAYKLAAIVFIDKSESPDNYDEEYCKAKIAKWKAGGASAFFTKEPVSRLIPFFGVAESSTQGYTEMINQADHAMRGTLESFLELGKNATPLSGKN